MTLVIVVVLVALAVGRYRGGSLHTLSHLRMPGWWLVLLAFLAQLLAALVSIAVGPGARDFHVLMTVVSAALALTFAVHNRHLRGMPIVAAGLFLNALVVVANGAMPVSIHAAQRAGIGYADVLSGVDPRHEPADRTTRWRLLGDVIPLPVPGPVGSQVLSPGDVLIAAGVGVLVANGMKRPGSGRQSRRLVADRDELP